MAVSRTLSQNLSQPLLHFTFITIFQKFSFHASQPFEHPTKSTSDQSDCPHRAPHRTPHRTRSPRRTVQPPDPSRKFSLLIAHLTAHLIARSPLGAQCNRLILRANLLSSSHTLAPLSAQLPPHRETSPHYPHNSLLTAKPRLLLSNSSPPHHIPRAFSYFAVRLSRRLFPRPKNALNSSIRANI